MAKAEKATAVAVGNADQLATVAQVLEHKDLLGTIDTTNEYAIGAGQNMPNHSQSIKGRGKFVRQMVPEVPTFRTKQQAYRYAAYLVEMADVYLPDEEGAEGHTFTLVREAITSA